MPMSERIDIDCPECLASGHGRQQLVVRTNRQSGQDFLGCKRWPDCQHTQKLPDWVLMERAGAERLPGW